MRVPFSLVIFAGLLTGTMVVGSIAAQAAEADTRCASTFTMLSASARSLGIPSQNFDRMAAIAAQHGGLVNRTAQEDARNMNLVDLEARVVSCHARYDGKDRNMQGNLRVASR